MLKKIIGAAPERAAGATCGGTAGPSRRLMGKGEKTHAEEDHRRRGRALMWNRSTTERICDKPVAVRLSPQLSRVPGQPTAACSNVEPLYHRADLRQARSSSTFPATFPGAWSARARRRVWTRRLRCSAVARRPRRRPAVRAPPPVASACALAVACGPDAFGARRLLAALEGGQQFAHLRPWP